MSSLYRAWQTLRSRSPAAQRLLVQQALQRVRAEGLGAALRWARARAHSAAPGRGVSRLVPTAHARRGVTGGHAGGRRAVAASAHHQHPDARLQHHAALDRRSRRLGAGPSLRTLGVVRRRRRIERRRHPCGPRPAGRPRPPCAACSARPERGGVSAASNLALARATGEFVALLDHDDVLAPHALASVVALLNASELDARRDLLGRRQARRRRRAVRSVLQARLVARSLPLVDVRLPPARAAPRAGRGRWAASARRSTSRRTTTCCCA